MLQVKNLTKKYTGADKHSAHDISFYVNDGEVLGLVGSNGAGKSTTIKSITGILPFDEGEIIVNGFDVKKQPVQAKQSLGYVPDDHSVYEKLTGREYVNYMGSLYGVSKADKQARLDHYAKLLEIEFALDNQIANYSHGMKQKICLIGALIHQPNLWVLDEPMLGLDPQTMKELQNLIRGYATEGHCVLFSSHNLDVVERVCDVVCIIRKGELVKTIRLDEAKKDKNFSLEKVFMEINGKVE